MGILDIIRAGGSPQPSFKRTIATATTPPGETPQDPVFIAPTPTQIQETIIKPTLLTGEAQAHADYLERQRQIESITPIEAAGGILETIFPPAAVIGDVLELQEKQPAVFEAIPQIIAETIFPPAALILEPAGTTFTKAQMQDTQTNVVEQMKEQGLPQEKIDIFIQSTTYPDTPTIPNILPDFTGLLDKIKTPLIIGAAALGGLYLIGKYVGGKK